MRYEARKVAENGISGARVKIFSPDGKEIGHVFAVDTEEKWIEQYRLNDRGKILVENGAIAPPVRLQLDFNVVDRLTLHEVRR